MTHLVEVNRKFIRAVEGGDEMTDNKVHLPTPALYPPRHCLK